MVRINVVEFYSGIGGMHYALQYADIDANVVSAYEINTTANAVYKHNFPNTKVSQNNIEAVAIADLEKLNADLWTMSPPCQPFTRQGKQEHSNDPRSKSFLNILTILSKMKTPPTYILLENVKGFECSNTRNEFIAVLKSRNFLVQEFLLSPTDFGIPNSRTRYFLIAKQQPKSFTFSCTQFPLQYSTETIDRKRIPCKEQSLVHENCVCKHAESVLHTFKQRKLSEFLCKYKSDDFLVKKEVLLRYFPVLDIVHTDSIQSCCFTKAYTKYYQGTGSILTDQSSDTLREASENFKEAESDEAKHEILSRLQLRFFTPDEVSQLMCFPDDFSFPPNVTLKQKYMLLGNSVNVLVVGSVFKWFLLNDL